MLTQTRKVNIDNILAWCGDNLTEATTPTIFKLVPAIERDNFGLVDKIKLRPLFYTEDILCFHDNKL